MEVEEEYMEVQEETAFSQPMNNTSNNKLHSRMLLPAPPKHFFLHPTIF